MQKCSLFLYQIGSGKAPPEWFLKQTQTVHIQRLYYIKGGKGYACGENGQKTDFEAGKLYLFPYNYPQRFVTDRDDPIDHVYFDFLSVPPLIGDRPIVLDAACDKALVYALRSAEEFARDFSDETKPRNFGAASGSDKTADDSEYKQIAYSLTYTILLLLSRNEPLPFVRDELILRAVEYMEENLSSEVCIRELAAEIGFEENYFIRRFKKAMGMTPYAFLRSRRLYEARERIADGMPLTHVSETVGYENASSLSRALKQQRQ